MLIDKILVSNVFQIKRIENGSIQLEFELNNEN